MPATKKKSQSDTLEISLPAAIPAAGHVPINVQTKLTRRQGAALKALRESLDSGAMRCEMGGVPSGRVVQQDGHVIRYLLDQVANALDDMLGDGWEPPRR